MYQGLLEKYAGPKIPPAKPYWPWAGFGLFTSNICLGHLYLCICRCLCVCKCLRVCVFVNVPMNLCTCKVPVYYLNADFDYWNMLDWNRPDIDCLHTVGSKSQVIEIRNEKII